ncbi:MAG: TIGR00289 family protein [Candidatus Nanoarchaeia archaeon]|nr:TIGR00289 family protein [Candidatus Nanoarchaeia archaeon]
MRLGVLFSGGKDSCLALYKAMQEHKAVCLISLVSENPESYMFHTPNIHITKLQSGAIGIPIVMLKTKGQKEEELIDLKKAIAKAKKEYKIEGIVSGAVRSVYQASRIEKICKDLELWCFNPLWLINQGELLKEVLKNKFKTIISGVFAYPFDKSYLGKIINRKMVNNLIELSEKYRINPAGEGGEIETTVLDAPFFKKKIKVTGSKKEYKDYSGNFIIKKAELVKK